MELKEEKEGGVLIVSPAGRLEARSSPEFESQILKHISSGEKRVLLDLSALEYVSSAGLRALLVATKRMREGNGKLAVCGLQPNVDEVFRVSGFDSILEVHPDRTAALAALA